MSTRVPLISSFLIVSILLVMRVGDKSNHNPVQTQENVIRDSAISPDNNIINNENLNNSLSNINYYKSLLLRLIRDEIIIIDEEDKYYFSDVFSPSYISMIPDSDFYIVDINDDRTLDIGICFPNNVLVVYYYHPETDSLSPSVDFNMYTEILGNGQILTISQTSTSISYQYQVINANGEKVTMISLDKEYLGEGEGPDGVKEENYLYRIRILINTESTKYKNYRVEVTKEQWDSFFEPLMELRKNVPKPFKYEELLN